MRSVLISNNYTGAETISMGSNGVDSDPESEVDFGDMKDSIKGDSREGSMNKRNRGNSQVG